MTTPGAPATPLQLLALDKCMAEVPDQDKARAVVTLAECLLAATQQKIPEEWGTDPRNYAALSEEGRAAAARFFPPTLGTPLSPPVQELVREWGCVFYPRVPTVTTSPQVAGGTIQVNTAEAQERAIKFVEYKDSSSPHTFLKVFRSSIAPNQWLYPHHWLKPIENGVQAAFLEWNTQRTRWFANGGVVQVPQVHVHKQERLLRHAQAWMRTIAALPEQSLEKIPFYLLRDFLDMSELFLEVFLLSGTTLASTMAIATSKFFETVDAQYGQSEAIDYTKAVAAAKSATAPSPPVGVRKR